MSGMDMDTWFGLRMKDARRATAKVDKQRTLTGCGQLAYVCGLSLAAALLRQLWKVLSSSVHRLVMDSLLACGGCLLLQP